MSHGRLRKTFNRTSLLKRILNEIIKNLVISYIKIFYLPYSESKNLVTFIKENT